MLLIHLLFVGLGPDLIIRVAGSYRGDRRGIHIGGNNHHCETISSRGGEIRPRKFRLVD